MLWAGDMWKIITIPEHSKNRIVSQSKKKTNLFFFKTEDEAIRNLLLEYILKQIAHFIKKEKVNIYQNFDIYQKFQQFDIY